MQRSKTLRESDWKTTRQEASPPGGTAAPPATLLCVVEALSQRAI
jgi:hypothetical protein